MKKTLLSLTIIVTAFVACKKKETTPTPTPTPTPNPTVYTKEDTLKSGQWKLTGASAFGGTVDLMTSIKDCQKDNLYTFNASKSLTIDEGATKCNSSDPQTNDDGSWNLSNNYAQISITSTAFVDLGFSTLSGDVVKLNSSLLEIKKDTTVSGLPTTINIKFTNVK